MKENFISPGSGIPKTAGGPPAATPAEPKLNPDGSPIYEPEAEPEVVTKNGKTVWFDDPFLQDQLLVAEKLCRVLPPSVRVFDTSKKEDLDAYNAILKNTTPAGSPKIIIEQEDRQFHNGAYIVFVRYSQVQYKHLAKESKS